MSVILGGGVIFVAWQSVSVTPKKSLTDGGKTGQFSQGDWRDALKVIPGDSLYPSLLGVRSGINSSTTLATTTTDRLGRELLTSYAVAQKSIGDQPMNDADAKIISDILAGKMMKDVDFKQYTEGEITIVPENTTTLTLYQKELLEAFGTFNRKNTVNELAVISDALNRNNGSKLEQLSTVEYNINVFTVSLLGMKVPQTVVSFHLELINNYKLLSSGIADMQQIINDPAIGLRGFAKYQKGMNSLQLIMNSM